MLPVPRTNPRPKHPCPECSCAPMIACNLKRHLWRHHKYGEEAFQRYYETIKRQKSSSRSQGSEEQDVDVLSDQQMNEASQGVTSSDEGMSNASPCVSKAKERPKFPCPDCDCLPMIRYNLRRHLVRSHAYSLEQLKRFDDVRRRQKHEQIRKRHIEHERLSDNTRECFAGLTSSDEEDEEEADLTLSIVGSDVDILSLDEPETSMKHDDTSMKHDDTSMKRDEPFVKRDEPSMKRDEPSMKRDEPSMKHDAPSMKHDAPSMKDYETSMKRDEPSMKRDAPSMKRDAPPMKSDEPPMKRDAPSMKHDEPPMKRDASSMKRDEPPMKRDAPPMKLNAHSMKIDAPSMKRDEPPMKRNEPPTKLDAPITYLKRGVTSMRRDAPCMRRDAPTMRRDIPSMRRDVPFLKREAPTMKRDESSMKHDAPPIKLASYSIPKNRSKRCVRITLFYSTLLRKEASEMVVDRMLMTLRMHPELKKICRTIVLDFLLRGIPYKESARKFLINPDAITEMLPRLFKLVSDDRFPFISLLCDLHQEKVGLRVVQILVPHNNEFPLMQLHKYGYVRTVDRSLFPGWRSGVNQVIAAVQELNIDISADRSFVIGGLYPRADCISIEQALLAEKWPGNVYDGDFALSTHIPRLGTEFILAFNETVEDYQLKTQRPNQMCLLAKYDLASIMRAPERQIALPEYPSARINVNWPYVIRELVKCGWRYDHNHIRTTWNNMLKMYKECHTGSSGRINVLSDVVDWVVRPNRPEGPVDKRNIYRPSFDERISSWPWISKDGTMIYRNYVFTGVVIKQEG